jgi:hypothetical protein
MLPENLESEAPKIERLLRRVEAAKYIVETYNLPCSPKTLAKIACISSEGPPFRKAGRFPLSSTARSFAACSGVIQPFFKLMPISSISHRGWLSQNLTGNDRAQSEQ